MIRFTGNIPQCMQQSRWTVPQILNDWSKYNMKMKELFDRGEFVVSAEVGPPKGIHVDELVEEAKTYQMCIRDRRLSGSAYGRRGISGWSECPILYGAGEWNHYPALQCEWDSFQCNGFCTEAEYECAIPSDGVVKGWTSCSRKPLLWFLHIL